MDSRRNFIGKVAGGIAGGFAAPGQVLGANERIRLGVIGPGARGAQLAREALACPNVELVAFADVYTERLEQARAVAPAARSLADYRNLLETKDLDAVIIATPQHLHREHFVAAMEAGKHVYLESAMAFTLDHARRMRAAFEKAGDRIVQIGHQFCSSGQVRDAANFIASGWVGDITAIRARTYRNTPHGKPQGRCPVYPDMTSGSIDWQAFLGEAPPREFDADRFVNWRLFWDYSGGGVFEYMSHQLAFWYKVLDLRIPEAVTMTAGLYLWKDGREVPDTMNVAIEHPEGILFCWDSGFGNNQLGAGEYVLGADGAVSRGQQIRYLPQKVNRPGAREVLGRTKTEPRAHVRNFLDCIRSGAEPNCPFELGYRVSIACRMAIDSYRQGRTLRWDPERQEIT